MALGTMHGKEAAIAPHFARIGITVERAAIDTDRFGTFSGEIARMGTMADAARSKARAAAEVTGLPVGLASEGAYGPHPVIPFLPIGQELLLWLDTETGHEIIETMTDERPSYDQQIVTSPKDAVAFLARTGFPAQAVIVQSVQAMAPVAKGITDPATFDKAVAQALAQSGQAHLQIDMRAHMNPRRMAVIGELAGRLAARLNTPCPACAAPGFGRLRTVAGLICRDCETETGLIAADVHGCTACRHEVVLPRAGFADPAHCPSCNP
ncbi:DUF6671 family protein [Paragemmobacter ruber]|nr:DUF6671 family protein [Rhodobacter ruber]